LTSSTEESDEKNALPDVFVGGPEDVGSLERPDLPALANSLAHLEAQLSDERDKRKEERFHWIVVTSVMFDVIAISALNGSWLFLPIFLLQLIALIGFARANGVDWAVQLIGQLFHWVSEWGKEK
jgi:hypothetical protein